MNEDEEKIKEQYIQLYISLEDAKATHAELMQQHEKFKTLKEVCETIGHPVDDWESEAEEVENPSDAYVLNQEHRQLRVHMTLLKAAYREMVQSKKDGKNVTAAQKTFDTTASKILI
jgi:hypothetical protein